MVATTGRNALRESLEDLMRSGLYTEWRQRAYSGADISSVLRELAALPPRDHAGRLRVAGFTPDPFRADEPGTDAGIEQSCHTCMYFSRHREFCTLPELKLPVRARWSCRLWRI